MKERSRMMPALAILVLTAGMLTATETAFGGSKKDKAEMAAAAKVTIDQAAKAATEKTAGKVIEAELEKEHGKLVWEVKTVTPDGKVTETHIDADSGSVIETKVKD